ncbi:hypothetical protein B0A48_04583 [Cryoendolithus antarcticus]|uniref:DNA ligase n=1 Tax=Cryoendolithus antarcticus TaxID=1507870 RepID=A0A1V8TFS5_9PEZI|nr:hypothetical protein B0A48_04583 [Cryoendolithus antarcticus]
MSDDDTTMVDINAIDQDAANEAQMMYGHGEMTERELDEKYPNRPKNKHKTLPFADLYLNLFNPLQENKRKPAGAVVNRRKLGPHGGMNPNDVRRTIIERFIGRWRREVGNDIFPAMRLIIPDRDKDRGMYGLKELTIGKLLVKMMKIDKNSDDGHKMLHWKLPGMKSSSQMTGDFAGRCFEVISKRPMLSSPGNMSIAEVNELLDQLSVAQKEENQLPIMQEFYTRMCAEELMWLIRMILRQMKIGATDKTLFEIWHADAENLFNISSSLKRVCWELYDPGMRLEGEARNIHLMQCFQPQLAQFQMRSMEHMVARMKPAEDDDIFWIEDKLDGERMQLHLEEDVDAPGGNRTMFYSRKGKDYTDLYGHGLSDKSGSLTKFIRDAFQSGVRSIILDGEMISWDMIHDKMEPFGRLKTAAISEQSNNSNASTHTRPLYKIFDCLYLNGKDLTKYTLRKRREALNASVHTVERRLEIHSYVEARTASEIEPLLREVVANRAEGLVLKNPRSPYRLNERNDDWIKVKPEYMTEFGEALDCVVIGAYWGSGRRGGNHSSFLCGLRVDQQAVQYAQVDPEKCLSFFKVGGGFTAADYQDIRHRTDGKWQDWDASNPPPLIVLGGFAENRQQEKPDQWIHPSDSVVLEVKAAEVTGTPQFATGCTLRFPRFKRLRNDKTWEQGLSLSEFKTLRSNIEEGKKDKQFKVDDERKKRSTRKRKRALVIQGQEEQNLSTAYAGPATKVFDGMTFCIMTEALKPLKKSKTEIEALVKANGGTVVASEKDPETICVADRNLVKVASIIKRGERNIIKPRWLYDAVVMGEADAGKLRLRLPMEKERHVYAVKKGAVEEDWEENVDDYGDSYCRNVDEAELLEMLNDPAIKGEDEDEDEEDTALLMQQLRTEDPDFDDMPGWLFGGLTAWLDTGLDAEARLFAFAGGNAVTELEDGEITHIVLRTDSEKVDKIVATMTSRRPMPRVVTASWVTESWIAKSRLDEERFTAH